MWVSWAPPCNPVKLAGQVWSLLYEVGYWGSHRALDLPKSVARTMSAVTIVDFFPLLIFDRSSRAVGQRTPPLEPMPGGWLLGSHTPSHGPHLGASVGTWVHHPRTPRIRHSFTFLGSVPILSKVLSSPPCVWRKRIIPSVPTDRSQGQRGHLARNRIQFFPECPAPVNFRARTESSRRGRVGCFPLPHRPLGPQLGGGMRINAWRLVIKHNSK